MNKAELINALSVGPDDAEVTIADYVGADLEIGDIIYFAEEKIFWIRPADIVADDDEIDEEGVEFCKVDLSDATTTHCGAPTEPPETSELPLQPPKTRGRQKAA